MKKPGPSARQLRAGEIATTVSSQQSVRELCDLLARAQMSSWQAYDDLLAVGLPEVARRYLQFAHRIEALGKQVLHTHMWRGGQQPVHVPPKRLV